MNESSITPTSAIISWDPPIANGVIRNYTVGLVVDSTTGRRRRKRQAQMENQCGLGNTNLNVGGNQTSLELMNLSEYIASCDCR